MSAPASARWNSGWMCRSWIEGDFFIVVPSDGEPSTGKQLEPGTKMKNGKASEIQTLCRFILEQDTGLKPAAYCLGSMEYCCKWV